MGVDTLFTMLFTDSKFLAVFHTFRKSFGKNYVSIIVSTPIKSLHKFCDTVIVHLKGGENIKHLTGTV